MDRSGSFCIDTHKNNHGKTMPHKKQGPNLEDQTRIKIAKYLTSAIDCAIQSYRSFYDKPTPAEAKEFSAHHSACKAAIAHIELLLKLAAWAQLPRMEGEDENLATLMAEAETELNNYHEEDDA